MDITEKVKNQKTIIGHSVWIGCNAVIMEGVKVGNGAVVGAGAIVTKDVKPYEIVVGIPAKHLRYRFDKEIIDNIENLNGGKRRICFIEIMTSCLKVKLRLT